MSCKCNSKCGKAVIQKYNFATQALTTTPTPLNMGATVTSPSGCAIVDAGNDFSINKSGIYRITAQVTAASTAAGTLNVQLYYNGTPLAETLKTIPVEIGSIQLDIDTIRYFCIPNVCGFPSVAGSVDVYAWVDNAITNVTAVTVNAQKVE